MKKRNIFLDDMDGEILEGMPLWFRKTREEYLRSRKLKS